jgi:ribosomal protein L12E/L44/L45/RPP1/RPP2
MEEKAIDDVKNQEEEEKKKVFREGLFVEALERWDAYVLAQQRLESLLLRGRSDLARARFAGSHVSEAQISLAPSCAFARVRVEQDQDEEEEEEKDKEEEEEQEEKEKEKEERATRLVLERDALPARRPLHWFGPPSEGLRSAENTFGECLRAALESAQLLLDTRRLCDQFQRCVAVVLWPLFVLFLFLRRLC